MVSDEDEGEIRCAVELVEDIGGVELIDFVEDNDILWAVIVVESVEKDVGRGGLTVNVECSPDALKDSVEGVEASMILPAVHVLGVEVDDGLFEFLKGVLGDTGLPGTGRAVNEDGFRGFTIGDGAEFAGDEVDFGVPVHHIVGHEFRIKHTRIGNHAQLVDVICLKRKGWVSGTSDIWENVRRTVQNVESIKDLYVACSKPSLCQRSRIFLMLSTISEAGSTTI